MTHYLLTAAGPDRPGIVAAVTEALFALGCNLEDSAMTRLRGEFAILLMFSAPDSAARAAIEAKLKSLEKSHSLSVSLKTMQPGEMKGPGAPRALWLVTVYGSDKPGIVYHVTQLLAKSGVNVTEVSTHRTESGGGAGYILYVEAEAPAAVKIADFDKSLQALGRDMGVTASVKAVEPTPL